MNGRPRLLLGYGLLLTAAAIETTRHESHEFGTNLLLVVLSASALLASRVSDRSSDRLSRTLSVSASIACVASLVLIAWSLLYATRHRPRTSVDLASSTVHVDGESYQLERDEQFDVPGGRRWIVTKDGGAVGFVAIVGKNVIGEPVEVRDSWATAIAADPSRR